MAGAKPRVKVPKSVAKGGIVKIKTLIKHPMENGRRKNKKTGEMIPKRIINKFSATFNGKEFFSINLYSSISANPYILFNAKVDEDGEFVFSWYDDNGDVYTDTKKITVK